MRHPILKYCTFAPCCLLAVLSIVGMAACSVDRVSEPTARTPHLDADLWGGGDPSACKNFYGEPVSEPGDCPLAPLDSIQRAAIQQDALRMLAEFASSSVCHTLGSNIQARLDEIYQTPYYFVGTDPHGHTGLVDGDFHPASASHPEQVHVAIGLDPLNPNMGTDHLTHVVRHEFAHKLGYGTAPGTDSMANVVADTYCGSGGSGGGSKPPVIEQPTAIGGIVVASMDGDDQWVY